MSNHRSLLSALLAVAALAALPALAAAADPSRALVFSQVVSGAEGEPEEGGLFAARNDRLNQLTENPADSQPDFSPDGRRIVFVRGGDLWAMRADGSGQHAITGGPELDGRPRFAPNGRYLLFERAAAAGAPRDLYTVRPSGAGMRRLVSSGADEREATFSGSGRAIAFVRGFAEPGGGTADDVLTVRPSGAALRRLTRTARLDEFAPRFFARGIVFSRGQSGAGAGAYADVFTMRGNGRGVRALIRGAGSAYVEDVSPNGRLLLFRRSQGLWTKPLPVGRRGARRARKLSEVADQSTTNAVFSSNGRHVAAFVATEERETLSAIAVAGGRSDQLARGFSLESGSTASTIGPVIAWQPPR